MFGYPDPTYFNRVKLELADRGVVMQEEWKKEIDTIVRKQKGSMSVK